jgi:nucleoside-diphosphate-sugar epimerase
MASTLILGGTRDIGHAAALELLAAGHQVTVLNRGHTADELPPEVERLRADRTHRGSMRSVIGDRKFDLVLDTTTYDGPDADEAVETFAGAVGRYVFISTGQVYLVRAGVERPFREEDYDGPLAHEPEQGTADHDSWLYGVHKRDAEEAFGTAWSDSRFPVTTLRIPIVASERDPAGRVQAYAARILDGGPLVIPSDPGLPLRHVYVRDVARLVAALAGREEGIGEAVNISSGESLSLREFLAVLADAFDAELHVAPVDRSVLAARALLPDCSPFSSPWMSMLDNRRGLRMFAPAGIRYTPPAEYLRLIAADYLARWRPGGLVPGGYEQRPRELAVAHESMGS